MVEKLSPACNWEGKPKFMTFSAQKEVIRESCEEVCESCGARAGTGIEKGAKEVLKALSRRKCARCFGLLTPEMALQPLNMMSLQEEFLFFFSPPFGQCKLSFFGHEKDSSRPETAEEPQEVGAAWVSSQVLRPPLWRYFWGSPPGHGHS